MSGIAIGPRPSLPSAMTLRQIPPDGVSMPSMKSASHQQQISSSSKDNTDKNTGVAGTARLAPNKSAEKKSSSAPGRLTEEELKVVQELQQRDAEVRTHEQAHMAAAGGYAIGGPSYDFQYGPDGKGYAVGGHVKLDVSPESTPEATIKKAETLRRAALAPADPSGADRAVAAAATKMEQTARKDQMGDVQEKKGDSKRIMQGIGKYQAAKDLFNTNQAKGEQINQQA